jgi:plasmid maintenance system antidote protein VapI
MNVGKSISIALDQNDKGSAWLAEQMGVSVSRVNALRNSTNTTTTMLERLSKIFDMPISEFISLSEND